MKRHIHHIRKLPRHLPALAVVVIAAMLGTYLTFRGNATTPVPSVEAESGTLAGGATTVANASASGGSAVQFGTSSGGFQANCINSPHACSYPDATNTGVPAGTTLTNSGSITVTTNGAVIQNLNISGQVVIHANNVTIKNSRITSNDFYPVDYSGYTGLTVQDTEIAGTAETVTACLSFDSYTAIRVNCHGGADGFKANANTTIQDSYIHDLAVSASSHNDGVQSTGGSNVTFSHNTCDTGTGTDCIQFGSSDTGWLVTNSLFNASGWMINGAPSTTNSSFTGNRFTHFSGGFGPASIPGSGITWTGNYYDDNGATANL